MKWEESGERNSVTWCSTLFRMQANNSGGTWQKTEDLRSQRVHDASNSRALETAAHHRGNPHPAARS